MVIAKLRMRYLVIVNISLQLWLSHVSCQALPLDGVKVVTYGEPCYHASRNLPVRIEEPAPPVTKEDIIRQNYQPLKLHYEVSHPTCEPESKHIQKAYPFFIEVPETKTPELAKTIPYQTKSYEYNIHFPTPPPESKVFSNYNFDVQVLPPSPTVETTQKPVKLLTGLTTRIDRILVPACEGTNSL